MTEKQLVAGLIMHSMLFSIGADYPYAKKERAKLSNALKGKFAIEKRTNKRYADTITLASKAFSDSWQDFPGGSSMSIAKVVYFLLVQNEELFKPYKINKKHIEKLNRVSNTGDLVFPSLEIAKSLKEHILKV